MKICLYLEFYHFLGGILFKKIGTGLLSSYKNQKAMLNYLSIPFTEQWDDSCDIFQFNTPWLKSIYLMKKVKRMGKKSIIFSHTTVEDAMQVFRFMPIIAPLYKKYLTYAYNLADMIFAPTEYTRGLLINYGISPDKIFAQSNAVDLKKYYEDSSKRKLGKDKYGLKTITIGTTGLVIPRKGIDAFLRVAEKFPHNQFMWYGKIYSSFLVKSLPKQLPANTRFTGYVDDVNEAYNSLDIFVFPSYEENQGMSILEAAAVGLPIIVRDIPVYNGWLFHGENCLKFKTDEEFEKYIKALITDEDLRVKLGQGALKLAKHESIEEVGRTRRDLYQKLLSA